MKKTEKIAFSKSDLIETYRRIGSIFYFKGDYYDALLYNNRYLSLAKESGDKRLEGSALNSVALTFDRMGELDKALNYYEESLKLINDERDKYPVFNNIALIYGQKSDYQKAISYLNDAIMISERYGEFHDAAKYLINLGNIYRLAQDFDRAERTLNEGLNRILKVSDKYWEARAYLYFGLLNKDKNNMQAAVDDITKAYNLFNSIGSKARAKEALSELNKVRATFSESNKANSK